ncbi:MAG: CPBP family intramembrane metalloprotease [Bacteroidetes bacterium]|nr:CPBP family intramembrane metalloprotease [Bacteroidota bacterium]MBS1633017.1 CPBP family intramembrane metalloprotease [Bacteroidota bacterium]
MKILIHYIVHYFISIDKRLLALCSLFTGILIFHNYYFNINDRINSLTFFPTFLSRYCIFLIAFLIPYLIFIILKKGVFQFESKSGFLLFLAPAVFSLKMAVNFNFHLSDNGTLNHYWNSILYWPLLLGCTALILFFVWKKFPVKESFYGFTIRNFKWKPYLLMLAFMIPLIALATTQPDFQEMYPKLKLITGTEYQQEFSWWHKLLFELSYGSDFITIELFFRGFLVLGFLKWFGKDSILPMACFYCAIHFGKPFGECISSYFGGIILGIIVYNTRSMIGGLVVHLGIAWMMEAGGYLGNLFR